MKKVLSILLIILFVLIISASVSNADTPKFNVEQIADVTELKPEEVVTVSINFKDFINGGSGINYFAATLSYDGNVFERVKEEDIILKNGWKLDSLTFPRLKITRDSNISIEHEVLVIKFKVKETARSGKKCHIALESIECNNGYEFSSYPSATYVDIKEKEIPISAFAIVPKANVNWIKQGEEVIVSVDIKNCVNNGVGINSINGIIEYDKNVFEVIKSEDITLKSGWEGLVYYESTGKFDAYNQKYMSEDHELLTLKLKAKIDATIGDTTVVFKKFYASNGLNADLKMVDVRIGNRKNYNLELVTNLSKLKPGEEVLVSMYLKDFTKNESGINKFSGIINYDKNVFEEIKEEDIILKNGWKSNGFVCRPFPRLEIIRNTNISIDHEALILKLKVKEDAKVGNSHIAFESIEGYDGAESYGFFYSKAAYIEIKGNTVLGNLDGKDSVTAFDAYKILELSVFNNKITEEELAVADINKDGSVNAFDAYLALAYSVGIKDIIEKYWK